MKKFLLPLTVTLLLLVMGLQMFGAAMADSATSDEQIHIFSGYETITKAHVLFDPEHPLLIKAISAIPLLFMHPNTPPASQHLPPHEASVTYNTYKDANFWSYQFLFTQGNNPYAILLATRTMVILVTLGLGLVLFLWTKQLFGTPSALTALTLFTFEPSFIAHGHLANDDTAAALFFVLGLMTFYHLCRKPTYRNMIIAGVVFGLGLLTKFSLLALGPIYILILAFWLTCKKYEVWGMGYEAATPSYSMLHTSYWRRHIAALLGLFITGWIVLWIPYLTLHFINPSQNPLTVNYATVAAAAKPSQHAPSAASLEGHVLGIITRTFPAAWTKGAALILPTSAGHARETYLLGACYKGSRWYYFPVLFAFKPPVPTIILTVAGFAIIAIYWLRRSFQDGKTARRQDGSFENWRLKIENFLSRLPSMPADKQDLAPQSPHTPHRTPHTAYATLFLILPSAFFLFISSFSEINIGFRHILPVYALFLIIASYPASLINWNALAVDRSLLTVDSPTLKTKSHRQKPFLRQRLAAVGLVLLLGAAATGTLLAYPNFIPYYNFLAGEPRPVPYISNDSNVDWGQATKELADYIQTHHIHHLAFDNFIGYGEATYLHLPYEQASSQNHNFKGYIAIGRSVILDHICSKNNDWGWLVDHQKPIAIIGNAINLYKVE